MRFYIEILRLKFKVNLQYRFNTWARLLGDIVFLIMWISVWSALYGNKGAINNITFQTTLVYVIFTQFLITMNNAASPLWSVGNLIRNGSVSNELTKPYITMMKVFIENISNSITYFFLSTFWVFTAAIIILRLPLPRFNTFILFFIAALLGFLVRYLIELCFAMLSFWVIEINGIRSLFSFSISLFSGSVVPLWFFPKTFKLIADILPFKYIYFIPSSIISEQLTGSDIYIAMSIQIIWIAMLLLGAVFIWKKGVKKLVVQGG